MLLFPFFLVLLLICFAFYLKTKFRNAQQKMPPKQLDKTWFEASSPILTPEAYQRSGDQSFLTYPEWFLVFSPAEQAAFFQSKTATYFPYEQHVEQFWDSYNILASEIAAYFPYNKQYHTMINVIGYSTLIEYRGKLLYEQTIGRLTASIPSASLSAEDQFYGAFMQRYVDFIQKEPWYLYNFVQELKRLWFQTTFLEWNIIRKLERRIFISSELIFKAIYGALLGLGTQSTYGAATPITAVVINQLPPNIQTLVPELDVIETLDQDALLVSLPRYAAFNSALTKLVQAGVQIKEIAGNTTCILMTIVVDSTWSPSKLAARPILQQIIPTQNHLQRVVLAVRIQDLSQTILQLQERNVVIEHIFDY